MGDSHNTYSIIKMFAIKHVIMRMVLTLTLTLTLHFIDGHVKVQSI